MHLIMYRLLFLACLTHSCAYAQVVGDDEELVPGSGSSPDLETPPIELGDSLPSDPRNNVESIQVDVMAAIASGNPPPDLSPEMIREIISANVPSGMPPAIAEAILSGTRLEITPEVIAAAVANGVPDNMSPELIKAIISGTLPDLSPEAIQAMAGGNLPDTFEEILSGNFPEEMSPEMIKTIIENAPSLPEGLPQPFTPSLDSRGPDAMKAIISDSPLANMSPEMIRALMSGNPPELTPEMVKSFAATLPAEVANLPPAVLEAMLTNAMSGNNSTDIPPGLLEAIASGSMQGNGFFTNATDSSPGPFGPTPFGPTPFMMPSFEKFENFTTDVRVSNGQRIETNTTINQTPLEEGGMLVEHCTTIRVTPVGQQSTNDESSLPSSNVETSENSDVSLSGDILLSISEGINRRKRRSTSALPVILDGVSRLYKHVTGQNEKEKIDNEGVVPVDLSRDIRVNYLDGNAIEEDAEIFDRGLFDKDRRNQMTSRYVDGKNPKDKKLGDSTLYLNLQKLRNSDFNFKKPWWGVRKLVESSSNAGTIHRPSSNGDGALSSQAYGGTMNRGSSSSSFSSKGIGETKSIGTSSGSYSSGAEYGSSSGSGPSSSTYGGTKTRGSLDGGLSSRANSDKNSEGFLSGGLSSESNREASYRRPIVSSYVNDRSQILKSTSLVNTANRQSSRNRNVEVEIGSNNNLYASRTKSVSPKRMILPVIPPINRRRGTSQSPSVNRKPLSGADVASSGSNSFYSSGGRSSGSHYTNRRTKSYDSNGSHSNGYFHSSNRNSGSNLSASRRNSATSYARRENVADAYDSSGHSSGSHFSRRGSSPTSNSYGSGSYSSGPSYARRHSSDGSYRLNGGRSSSQL